MRGLSAPSASSLSGWKRLALVLLAVPAILVGLLAMHVLTTGPSHAPAAHSAEDHEHAPLIMGELAATSALGGPTFDATDCGGDCGPEHDMLGMACVLALLLTALLLTVHLTLLRWGTARAIASTIMGRIAALAPPRPPSLLVLSISRT